jgi:hypothetical protein
MKTPILSRRRAASSDGVSAGRLEKVIMPIGPEDLKKRP